MSTLTPIKQGLHEAWDGLLEGWRRLYRRAAAAITRYTGTTRDADAANAHELETRNAGWGVLAGEVCDDGEAVVVRLEAPGMEREDFYLVVLDDHLLVRGEKRFRRDRRVGRYHVTERAYGRFERSIPLPTAVDDRAAEASYRRGVLEIRLPRSRARQGRRIDIDIDIDIVSG